MPRLVLFLLLFIFPFYSFSQSPDFISVHRKNGQIIKTFEAGSSIIFETKNELLINGRIKEIKNDSLFIISYDIRNIPTNLGVTMPDTVARYVTGFNYKDILKIKVFKRHRFIRGKIDRLLIFGGAGYAGLNIINGLYSKQSITGKDNLKRLGISMSAVGIGFILKKYFYVNRFSRRRHRIVYVKVK